MTNLHNNVGYDKHFWTRQPEQHEQHESERIKHFRSV